MWRLGALREQERNMIDAIKFIANVGEFERVDDDPPLPLARLTLLYAENARGKTTLAEVLRSLATGDATLLASRQRLDTKKPSRVIINVAGQSNPVVFEDGAWASAPLETIRVFDDAFAFANVSSGLDVYTAHRKNLHELILGQQGVDLDNEIRRCMRRTRELQDQHRKLRERIREAVPFKLAEKDVDEFCRFPPHADVDAAIHNQEQLRAAVAQENAIRDTPSLSRLELPAIDADAIRQRLRTGLANLNDETLERVTAHLRQLNTSGEQWVRQGMEYVQGATATNDCPFCGQDLTISPLIAHYQQYFGDAYRNLNSAIRQHQREFSTAHGSGARSAFLQVVQHNATLAQFWSPFCEVGPTEVNGDDLLKAWADAADPIDALLRRKTDAPLDEIALPDDVSSAIVRYEDRRRSNGNVNNTIDIANREILEVKAKATSTAAATVDAEILRLQKTKARYSPDVAALCAAYDEKQAEIDASENEAQAAKEQLEEYRNTVFPEYEAGVNKYLERFSATFQIKRLRSQDITSGPISTYAIEIKGEMVPVAREKVPPDEHSFGSTLSAGDRSTLALAFFFEALRQHPQVGELVVVIDDPVSSLDEHRLLMTVEEIKKLVGQVAQVIVLSHNKRFLATIWDQTKTAASDSRTALKIVRRNDGSSLLPWDVSAEVVTMHDILHKRIETYVQTGSNGDERSVAEGLRPYLEGFLRVMYPAKYPPGTMIGNFLKRCRETLHTDDQILASEDMETLASLLTYANLFHHDTNPLYDTVEINAQALTSYARRTLAFTTFRGSASAQDASSSA